MRLANELNVADRIVVRLNEKPDSDIEEATIITNSGFLRPLNREFLVKRRPDVVIPLMYGAWEIRESDIHINAANELQIKIAGTFENHESIRVFNGVGPLAIKLALEAGFEVYKNNITEAPPCAEFLFYDR